MGGLDIRARTRRHRAPTSYFFHFQYRIHAVRNPALVENSIKVTASPLSAIFHRPLATIFEDEINDSSNCLLPGPAETRSTLNRWMRFFPSPTTSRVLWLRRVPHPVFDYTVVINFHCLYNNLHCLLDGSTAARLG